MYIEKLWQSCQGCQSMYSLAGDGGLGCQGESRLLKYFVIWVCTSAQQASVIVVTLGITAEAESVLYEALRWQSAAAIDTATANTKVVFMADNKRNGLTYAKARKSMS